MCSPAILAAINYTDLVSNNWIRTTTDSISLLICGQSKLELRHFQYPITSIEQTVQQLLIKYQLNETHTFELNISPSGVEICTFITGELQLYYFQTDEFLFFSDSFAHLVTLIGKQQPLSLDPQGIYDLLSFNPQLELRSLVVGIKILKENQVLKWEQGKITTCQRVPLEQQVISFQDCNTIETVTNHLTSEIDAHVQTISQFIPPAQQCCTLSGGVDSAIVSHRAAIQYIPTFVSIQMIGPKRDVQTESLVELHSCLGGNQFVTSLEVSPLLDSQFTCSQLDPYTDPYSHVIQPLLSKMRQLDSCVVYTGLGADDSYYQFNSQSYTQEKVQQVAEISNYFLLPWQRKTETKRHSLLPPILSNSQLVYTPQWRMHGIWPVSPFISPALISLSAQIPTKFKEQKQLLRSYVTDTMSCPKTAMAPSVGFSEYFFTSLTDFYRIEGRQLLQSNTMLSGIIDTQRVLQQTDKEIQTNNLQKNTAFVLYGTLRLMLFLQKVMKT